MPSPIAPSSRRIAYVIQVAGQREKELLAVQKMLDEEKQQRAKIVESLRGTIQRVRAAGHEEDRLQNELVQLTTQLVQEKRKREQASCDCTAAQQQCKELSEQLASANAQKLEAQHAVKQHTLEVRHFPHFLWTSPLHTCMQQE